VFWLKIYYLTLIIIFQNLLKYFQGIIRGFLESMKSEKAAAKPAKEPKVANGISVATEVRFGLYLAILIHS
jgi:hypothetical protein